jgi:hypothetical protein
MRVAGWWRKGRRAGGWWRPSCTVAVLLAAGAMALGARCIDRTSTYVDKDGYTHITGEMVNDTDIQGTQIRLRGTLYNDAGDVVATKEAPTCPPDTQPHEQTVFDIRFDNPRFDVQPVAGKVLASPLPGAGVVVLLPEAVRFTSPYMTPDLSISTKDVFFRFRVRNQTNQTIAGVQGCAAVYDQRGDVVFVDSSEIIQVNPDGSVSPASLSPQWLGYVYMVAKDVPAGPVQVRAWLWFGPKGAPSSGYQFVSTGLITIQPVSP